MPRHVVEGAQLKCSFGTTPSALGVPPKNRAWSTTPCATILDHVPTANIRPFGMCMSPSNPQVAAATTAALGVLTPQPCIPCTVTPWTPGVPANTLAGAPILNDTSTLACTWGGVITVMDAGQQTANVP
ncbi:DUF4280 domain-containing protein [Roseomonas eburnea]|uniref:DUF4280 domain-containing protein n=1 Tax=Neoroseomonas eburnea TaxID=1346889 RepID=A0A9X9X7D2_9PROT|nr:DUF4280 domain-containing protein [Neoroseomonas eburnea]MBR0679618.1 DUF4280 domain-containing protein [Neoroseomonas eburnea]